MCRFWRNQFEFKIMNNSNIKSIVLNSVDKKIQVYDKKGVDFVAEVEDIQCAPEHIIATLLIATDEKEKIPDNSHRRRLPLTVLSDEGRSIVTYLTDSSPINREICSVEVISDD